MKKGILAGIAALTCGLIAPMLGAAGAHAAPGARVPAAVSGGCSITDNGVWIAPPMPVLGWAENVGYDRSGDLWVSRTLRNVVQRYDRAGRVTASVVVDSPGAVRLGPDGRMYVTSGDTTVNMIPGLPLTGRVLRFRPPARTGPEPVLPQVFATGLGMPNGLAFDARGAVYVADSNLGVVRIDPRGVIDRGWTARAPKNLAPTTTVNGTGVNGIAIADGVAYVTLTSSLSGRVLRIPLDRPEKIGVATDLTAPLPGFVDDVAVLGGRWIAAATTTGQVIVVDLRSGRRCSTFVGEPLTSIAVTPGDDRRLVAGTESGNIRVLRVVD
ncbi:hypothetical protein QSJ18_19715 [Gordonia sp. ABSL1-1]|uniref:SMP-30/gluconolactonase/LRE family protein n=1 Tax=Gordonia sp. ABSL1-1 TaxID=3053923 RepID=UPI0025730AAE|nr:hypothetical protein [Gordonia sp. ABSL1-1]MDL9938979.1 hypothetical protein [Gordonia sp. ABSL1-1]